jgi:hypothetical protein
MNAAIVVDALDLHDRLVGRGLQHAEVAAASWVVLVHGAPQRYAPEAGGPVHVGGSAIDQYGA